MSTAALSYNPPGAALDPAIVQLLIVCGTFLVGLSLVLAFVYALQRPPEPPRDRRAPRRYQRGGFSSDEDDDGDGIDPTSLLVLVVLGSAKHGDKTVPLQDIRHKFWAGGIPMVLASRCVLLACLDWVGVGWLPVADAGCGGGGCRYGSANDKWLLGGTSPTAAAAAKEAFGIVKEFRRGVAPSDDHYRVQTLAPIREHLEQLAATHPHVRRTTLGELCGMFWPEHQRGLAPGSEDAGVDHFFTVPTSSGLDAVMYPVLHRDCAASRNLWRRLAPAIKL